MGIRTLNPALSSNLNSQGLSKPGLSVPGLSVPHGFPQPSLALDGSPGWVSDTGLKPCLLSTVLPGRLEA